MFHFIKYKANRIRYYFKLLIWARDNYEKVKDYQFLIELKEACHNNYLEAERTKRDDKMLKASIQEELITKILSHIQL